MGKKLKIGDEVYCSFLGENCTGKVVEVKSSNYNVEVTSKNHLGTILPNIDWYKKPKKQTDKLPWYIHEKKN